MHHNFDDPVIPRAGEKVMPDLRTSNYRSNGLFI
jgi:hypothetical protein